ncbi:hypothetical protein SAMN05421842_12646 [Clostridium uliginosum]|uniref:Uncharacterized protein n=1 Tax=Clostridium uliginosum TaxID=119641 RepID=A0A1I1QQ80_9CLOT|nr:hypothetical protein SAMN05421842_12646 [Clostridium uliginosum]
MISDTSRLIGFALVGEISLLSIIIEIIIINKIKK